MRSLLQDLFHNEFVIDEPREQASLDSSSAAAVGRPAPAARPEPGAGPPQTASAANDLLSQIAFMLQEHERLEAVATELRNQGSRSSDEQLVRFFRMALGILDSFERINMLAVEMPPSEEVQNWLKTVSAAS